MRAVLNQGTTLVFVSHDLAAVEATCTRGVWLHQGVREAEGPVREVVNAYRQSIEAAAESAITVSGELRLVKVEVSGPDGGPAKTQAPLDVRLVIDSPAARAARLYLGVSEGPATPIFVLRRDLSLAAGETKASCAIHSLPLPRGRYYLWVGVFEGGKRDPLPWHPATHFDVAGPNLDVAPRGIVRLAPIHVDTAWELER
jgi:hypothetical protein